ncbi:MAG: hypothetical protein V4736_06230 [Bdellovibrionota bacterium]
MKSLISFLIFFATSAAFAWPHVGQSRRMATSFFGSEETVSGFETLETVVGINDQTDVMQISTVMIDQHGTNSYTNESPYKQTVSAVQTVLSKCSGHGGTSQTITVPAGTFKTCKLINKSDTSKSEIWYAAVLFGYVKFRFTNLQNGLGHESNLISHSGN